MSPGILLLLLIIFLPDMNSVISIENLSKTYQSGFEALKNVSLEIKKGDHVERITGVGRYEVNHLNKASQ